MRLAIPRPPLSLRWQLTVWHSLGLGLVLSLFTLAVYSLLARNLSDQVDRSLVSRAQQLNRAIQRDSPFSQRQPVEVELPNTFASADIFVQVTDLDGNILGRSENLSEAALPITQEDLAAVREGRDRFAVARIGGEDVRIYTAPLPVPDHAISLVQVARSLEPTQSALAELRWLAGIGLLLSILLAGGIVWVTAERALRPLEHVIDTSEAIGASNDLGRRVGPTHMGDEVGRLARSFDRMLERLEASDADLREANRKLADSLQAQRRFTADASHELRTPLTTIRGYAGMLRQFAQVTHGDRVAAVAQIDYEAERMTRLVENLLILARADSGQSLRRVPVSLHLLVRDVVAQARLLARGQQIQADIAEPVDTVGDPDALRQLALILLDNAIKYTPPDGHIEVRLQTLDDVVELSVTDDGSGISEQDLPHVFERFYRTHRDGKSRGTGLGLSIAEWIAAQHGGSVHVCSAPGQGSTFTVRLPLGHTPSGQARVQTARTS